MAYPSNWMKSAGENSATIAPPAGASQNAIAYGVIVGSHRMQDQTLGAQDIVHDRHSTGRVERLLWSLIIPL